jgi:hypothetical protein
VIDSRLVLGRIVWATVRDKQGRNEKRRPLVVIVPRDELTEDGPIPVVALTTTFPLPVPKRHVKVPWENRPGGHRSTRLREESYADCEWIDQIYPDQVEDFGGLIHGTCLAGILTNVGEVLDGIEGDGDQAPPANEPGVS